MERRALGFLTHGATEVFEVVGVNSELNLVYVSKISHLFIFFNERE